MSVVAQYAEAARGWFALAFHRPGWRERFATTREGLIAAVAGYFAAVVGAILIQGIFIGTPSASGLLAGVAINALPLLGLSIAIYLTILVLRLKVRPIEMLVPAVHALTFLLVAGFVLSAIGGALSALLIGLLAYLLFRGGREVLGLGFAFALAYAALSIVLLVALPASLYMLMAPGPGGPI